MFLMKCLKGRNYAVDKMMSDLSVSLTGVTLLQPRVGFNSRT